MINLNDYIDRLPMAFRNNDGEKIIIEYKLKNPEIDYPFIGYAENDDTSYNYNSKGEIEFCDHWDSEDVKRYSLNSEWQDEPKEKSSIFGKVIKVDNNKYEEVDASEMFKFTSKPKEDEWVEGFIYTHPETGYIGLQVPFSGNEMGRVYPQLKGVQRNIRINKTTGEIQDITFPLFTTPTGSTKVESVGDDGLIKSNKPNLTPELLEDIKKGVKAWRVLNVLQLQDWNIQKAIQQINSEDK